jgi:hypothetical protein
VTVETKIVVGDARRSAGAAPEEAAAIVAAVSRFLRDTAFGEEKDGPAADGWVAVARVEAVDREPRMPDGWRQTGNGSRKI